MPVDVTMPQLGESVTEGTVGRWLKQPGEPIAQYEALLEVTTDKVDTEITVAVDGTVLELLVAEGETVKVGTTIARLVARGEVNQIDTRTGVPERRTREEPKTTSRSVMQTISPVVARLAAEHRIDLDSIVGSGTNGRVTKKDIEHYLSVHTQVPHGDELVPLTSMRRAIAEHMVRSRGVPQGTTVMEVDFSRVAAHRDSEKGDFERQGVRLTYTAYIVQAAVKALSTVPMVNASYRDNGIVMHRQINIGLAVAIADGLLVPVLKDANKRDLLGIARGINDLAERARTHRLQPHETQNGTFTITNHGVSGSIVAVPMINQQQAAILGIGAIEKRVVVISEQEQDSIAIRLRSYLSLTFDHRVMDGATADEFLRTLKNMLEVYD